MIWVMGRSSAVVAATRPFVELPERSPIGAQLADVLVKKSHDCWR